MVRTDLSIYSQYWTPSSRCAPSYRRPSVTTNVTLAYADSGTGLCCSLRKRKAESFLISKKEDLSQTSGGLPSVTPLLPQRQQARRLTKMQGCYSANIHYRYKYNGNHTQYSPRLPDPEADDKCNVINSKNQASTRCHLHQLTNDSFELQKRNQADEENLEHEERSDNTPDKIDIPSESDSSNRDKGSCILNIPPLPNVASPIIPNTCRTVHITLNTSSETLSKPACSQNVVVMDDATRQHTNANNQAIHTVASNSRISHEYSLSTPLHSTPRNTPQTLPKMTVMNLSFMTMQAGHGIRRETKYARPVSRKLPIRMNLNLHSSRKTSHRLPQLPDRYGQSIVGDSMHISSAKLHVVTPITTPRHSTRMMQTTKLPQISTGIYKLSPD